MPRVIVTLLIVFAMLSLGLVGLQYQAQTADTGNMSATENEAFNLTTNVSQGATESLSRALPWLGIIVLLSLLAGFLLMVGR